MLAAIFPVASGSAKGRTDETKYGAASREMVFAVSTVFIANPYSNAFLQVSILSWQRMQTNLAARHPE